MPLTDAQIEHILERLATGRRVCRSEHYERGPVCVKCDAFSVIIGGDLQLRASCRGSCAFLLSDTPNVRGALRTLHNINQLIEEAKAACPDHSGLLDVIK